jgi:hypothetical protein
MSYYLVNEKRIELPENFNGIAVFYPKEKEEKIIDEQKVLFQRLFENGLNMKLGEILWVETDPVEAAYTFKNKDTLNCCLFFGVDPARAGFRVQLPVNKFAAVNNIQILQTVSPKELNQKPDMKKALWNALQVLK